MDGLGSMNSDEPDEIDAWRGSPVWQRRLEYIATADAGALVELRNIQVAIVLVEGWNYQLTSDRDGIVRVRQTGVEPRSDIAKCSKQPNTVIVHLDEQAYIFGDEQVIVLQPTDQAKCALIAIEGLKGYADLSKRLVVR